MIGLVVVAASLLVAPPPGKGASNKKGSWVALVRTKDVPPSWREELQKAAEEAKDKQWVPPPAVTLEEAQLALGCSGWNTACQSQIATMAGATMALVVDVQPKPDGGTKVTVQAVKAAGGTQTSEDGLETLAKGREDLELAQDLVRGIARNARPTFLAVITDVPGVEVHLDGVKVGPTPYQTRVMPGEHELKLTMEGKAPITKTLTLRAGQNHVESLSMNAQGPAVDIKPLVGGGDDPPPLGGNGNGGTDTAVVEVPAPEGPPPAAATAPPTMTVGFGLAGVGGALTLAGTLFLGTTVFDLYNRVPCGTDGATQCMPSALMFGLYTGPNRQDFLNEELGGDWPSWIAASVAGVGVGGLLIATGVVLATTEPGAPVEEAAPPAGEPRPAE